MAAGGQKAIVGIVELALEGIHLQVQRRALVDIAGLVDMNRAHGVDPVIRNRVVQLVRTDHGVATAQARPRHGPRP